MSRFRSWFAGGLAVALALCDSHVAQSAGTIETAGATIATGAAPTAGAVVIDAAADPQLAGPLPPLTMPVAPDAPSPPSPLTLVHGGPSFNATADITLPGGTYDFDSYIVAAGVRVRYDGPVTIRTTGNVRIVGTVSTNGARHSISFVCGGDFVVDASATQYIAGVQAAQTDSDLTIDAAGAVAIASADGTIPWLNAGALGGAVRVTSRGAPGITAESCELWGYTSLDLHAAGAVSVLESNLSTNSAGSLRVRSHSGAVTLDGSSLRTVFGSVEIDARDDITATGGSDVDAASGCSVRSAEGRIVVDGGAVLRTTTGTGELRIDAGAGIDIIDGRLTSVFLGVVSLRSPATIRVRSAGRVEQRSNAPLALLAGGDVLVEGTITGVDQGVLVQSAGGAVTAAAGCSLSSFNMVSFAATTSLDIAAGAVISSGRVTALSHGTVSIRAPISTTTRHYIEGDFSLSAVAQGDVAIDAPLRSAGNIVVRSLTGNVDLRRTTVETTPDAGGDVSGSIEISCRHADGVIDVSDAVVRTGGHPQRSGDIRIEVAPDGHPPVDGALVVTSVRATRSRAAWVRQFSGFIDTGSDVAELTGPVRIRVAGHEETLTLTGEDERLRGSSRALRIEVARRVPGSSRVDFTLRVTDDHIRPATEFRQLEIEFPGLLVSSLADHQRANVSGDLALAGLARPAVALLSLAARRGASADGTARVRLLVPALRSLREAGDVDVAIGSWARAIVPAGAFLESAPGRYVAGERGAPGRVRADLTVGVLDLDFTGLDLSALPVSGGSGTEIRVTVGGVLHTLRVRLAASARSLDY